MTAAFTTVYWRFRRFAIFLVGGALCVGILGASPSVSTNYRFFFFFFRALKVQNFNRGDLSRRGHFLKFQPLSYGTRITLAWLAGGGRDILTVVPSSCLGGGTPGTLFGNYTTAIITVWFFFEWKAFQPRTRFVKPDDVRFGAGSARRWRNTRWQRQRRRLALYSVRFGSITADDG
ncbi:hypothetical protein CTA2_12028 [Colletotrichum tanaceti]|uniref:Uncharacterized protein n=1 Tax=Colletotrichum tanaceti TaxID=1306861 RepID=A0A4U6XHB2_9PEZI|nr:hypothetical protein CTA2_12028 [Colletotrichum tanaceti]TKW54923.1 hypothetical protein CTA1_5349 [Colletotrichum tanaceti]